MASASRWSCSLLSQHAGDGRQLADQEARKAYCILFLLLETGMLGVFCALDFFLFYVFWEVMLLPMYFLIGIWGGPRKEYAAIKFFLYTLVGSVLMLIAILMLYFNSDPGPAKLPAEQAPGHRRRSVRTSTNGPTSRWPTIVTAAHAAPHVQHPGPAADGPAHRSVHHAKLVERPFAAVVGVPAAVHRLRHQSAQRAAAHLAARRARRGARRPSP